MPAIAKDKVPMSPEIEDLAFELFRAFAPSLPPGKSAVGAATLSFRRATEFLSARDVVRNEGIPMKAADRAQLAEFCAPNLPKSHPHNLVSQRHGNLETVKRVYQWLCANPTPEMSPESIVPRFKKDHPSLGWDLGQIELARVIFASYV